MNWKSKPRISKVALVAAIAALALVLPFNVHLAAQTQHIRWQDGFMTTEIEIRGAVEFADNDADVKSLSSDGYFRIEQWSGGSSRSFAVRPSGNGLERQYSVNGFSKPLDSEARAWLARVLPEVIRENAIDAPVRVKRILSHQGPAGVFAEVNKIHSDHARRVYLENLLDYGNLREEDLRETLRLGRKISSDGEKAGFLIAAESHYQSPAVREAYFDTADSISSDGEHRRVLNAVLDRYGADHDTLALVLHSAKRISSDGEKANVLIHAADFRLSSDAARVNFFRASDSVNSDGERHRVLEIGRAHV